MTAPCSSIQGLIFPMVLRSILRQDPDVILLDGILRVLGS